MGELPLNYNAFQRESEPFTFKCEGEIISFDTVCTTDRESQLPLIANFQGNLVSAPLQRSIVKLSDRKPSLEQRDIYSMTQPLLQESPSSNIDQVLLVPVMLQIQCQTPLSKRMVNWI